MTKPLSEDVKTSREAVNIQAVNLDAVNKDVINIILHAIGDSKGTNLSLIDVSKLSDIANYFIITSGRSDRQVQGIANKILEALQIAGIEIPEIEGMDEGQWILLDLGDVVVHVFYEATREYYDFDSLWARAEHINIPHAA